MYKQALEFATKAHEGQVRKHTGLPYISHPIAVAETVWMYTGSEELQVVALLHDTVEDTAVTVEEIAEKFGARIATMVSELTNVTTLKDGPRALRKSLERAHIGAASDGAKIVKLADIMHNVSCLKVEDPKFAPVYIGEKLKIMETAISRDVHPMLYDRVMEVLTC